MKPKEPILLLFLWFILPLGIGNFRLLVAQVILSQIQSIQITRQSEKKLNLDDENDELLRQLLVALWLNPNNTTAYTYLKFIAPELSFFGVSNEDQLSTNPPPSEVE